MGVFADGDGAHVISNSGRATSVVNGGGEGGSGYGFSIAGARRMSIWHQFGVQMMP
jgi:hypothetical protein